MKLKKYFRLFIFDYQRIYYLILDIKLQKVYFLKTIISVVINVKVKIFDCSHEKDLEKKINEFLKELNGNVVDIKYSSSIMLDEKSEQIYCFSALIIYQE